MPSRFAPALVAACVLGSITSLASPLSAQIQGREGTRFTWSERIAAGQWLRVYGNNGRIQVTEATGECRRGGRREGSASRKARGRRLRGAAHERRRDDLRDHRRRHALRRRWRASSRPLERRLERPSRALHRARAEGRARRGRIRQRRRLGGGRPPKSARRAATGMFASRLAGRCTPRAGTAKCASIVRAARFGRRAGTAACSW